MSAVEKIVEALISLASDRLSSGGNPKSRAVRSLLELYDALVETRDAYRYFKSQADNSMGGPARTAWKQAIERLNAIDVRLRNHLSIASPNTAEEVARYLNCERTVYDGEWNLGPGKYERIEELSDSFSEDAADAAIATVRSFIQEHYTFEDLFS